jgi:N utilization substance protein A
MVSRADSRFLAKLLELEIPEIANGNIEIRQLVRQTGERAKVAVVSKEKDIDPVGACIGVKGNRILAISKELGGEKIDIIEWSDDLRAFAMAALSPAKVLEVSYVDKDRKTLYVRVGKDQFSLAIGKKGTNVRLASRLLGWKIEIKSD